MNGYTTFLLVAIGVLDLVTSEENYSEVDDTDLISQDYNLRSNDKIRLDKSDFGKDQPRKTRFYQYYRIKKLRGKTSVNDDKKNIYAYERKEPILEKKDKDLYDQNISFVQHYLGNDTSSFYEKGDTRSKYPDGELNDIIVNYKQYKDTKRLKDEIRKTDFPNVRNFKYYKFNNKHGKSSNAHISRFYLTNNLAKDREQKTIEDMNLQVIYIRKNKNDHYLKKIPDSGKDRKLQPSHSIRKPGKIDKNIRNLVNINDRHNLMSNHYKESQNKSDQENDGSQIHDPHQKVHEKYYDHYDIDTNNQNINFQNNNNQYKEGRNKNYTIQVNKSEHQTNKLPFPKFSDNLFSDGSKSSSQNIFNYVELIKDSAKFIPDKNIGEKIYRYYGIATNTLYHRDRNNRNNSKHRENSYHNYQDKILQNDDDRKISSESKEYSKGNVYSENSELEQGYISPNEIRSFDDEEKSNHFNKLNNEHFERKLRIVSNGRGNYKRRFEQKTYDHNNDKGESMKELDINIDKIHSGTPAQCKYKHNCKLGNSTRKHRRLRKSMTNRNINWPRRNAEYYRSEKHYFGAYGSDNVSTPTPIDYQNSDKNMSNTYYPLEPLNLLEPTNYFAEMQSAER